MIKNKKVLIESLIITILVFISIWLFYILINISFKPFNYLTSAFKIVNLNDLYFSDINNNSVDTNIVVVNIGDSGRDEIANLLLKINEEDPKVIGIDVFFSKEIQTPHDSLLNDTFLKIKDKLVMAGNYENFDLINSYWSYDGIASGHSGLLTNAGATEIVRKFEPKITVEEKDVHSFSAVIASKYDLNSFNRLKKRGHNKEFINYIGGYEAFKIIDAQEFLTNENVNFQLKGKIVMVGLCQDPSSGNISDAFFTPVGFKMSSFGIPDMSGILIHANIISMIINDKFINFTPQWIVYLLTLLIVYMHIVAFVFLSVFKPLYFNLASKFIPFISFILTLWIVFLLFSHCKLYFPTIYLVAAIALSLTVLGYYKIAVGFIFRKFKIKSIFVKE